MDKLEFTIAEKISLKNHPDYNEDWLQAKIADNTQILNLGELNLVARERKQKTGRLDILLENYKRDTRYEVEIMLGQLDESHIIRCIEYWDIEKRRYPYYEHIAVIIAEDITSRFLNVLGLFNGHIPLIAIQLNALKIEDKIVLDFVKVMDLLSLRRDDSDDVKINETNRDYWESRATKKTVDISDKILEVINANIESKQQLNFNKHYIGLSDGIKSRNFIFFKPKKQFTHIFFEVADQEKWVEKFDLVGISSNSDKRLLQVTVSPVQLTKNFELINELVIEAVKLFNQ